MDDRERRLEEYERGFRRAGLPLFSEDFSAAEDVFNRAAPLLGLVFFGELLGAVNLDWPWWQNLLAVLGGLAVLLGGFGLINKAKGRPFSTVPERLGRAELTGFVVIPALLPLLNGQTTSAWVTALVNVGLLALIYAVGSLGLGSVIRWVLRRLGSQLRSAPTLMARALPLLAIFVLLSFPTQELWRIFADPTQGIYALMIGMLALLGSAFIAVRLPRETKRLEQEVGGDSQPLNSRQRLNVAVVMFVSQAVQVLLVSLMIGAFLTVFGLLAVDEALRTEWLGRPGDELLAFELFGERLELTTELLRVAGGLAAFSGFYFSIAIFTDATYRQEFLDELTNEMRESFRRRAEYLRLRGTGEASA